MLLKDLKKTIPHSQVKTFDGKRVLYTNPYDIENHLNDEDWEKVRDWNGICIYPSPKNKPNQCFYFNWGWGGSPEYIRNIMIS